MLAVAEWEQVRRRVCVPRRFCVAAHPCPGPTAAPLFAAIDFYCTVDKIKGKHGEDRAVITFNGRFTTLPAQLPLLPPRSWAGWFLYAGSATTRCSSPRATAPPLCLDWMFCRQVPAPRGAECRGQHGGAQMREVPWCRGTMVPRLERAEMRARDSSLSANCPAQCHPAAGMPDSCWQACTV